MAQDRFIVQLTDGQPGDHHTLRRFRVRVDRAPSAAFAKPVPIVGAGAPVPDTPSCWLQIWHLGSKDSAALHLDSYEAMVRGPKGYPPADVARDVLVADIPGFIRELDIDQYEFRALGPIRTSTVAARQHAGWLTLELKGAQGTPFTVDGGEPRVPLSLDGADDFLMLSSILEDDADTPQRAPARAPMLQVCNLSHVVGAMLDEEPPGLTLGFHVIVRDAAGNPVPANTNDGSFFKYGEWVARFFGSVGLTPEGELTANTTAFSSADDIEQGVAKIMGQVRGYLGRGDVLIKRLFIVTHGDNNPKYFKESGGGIELRDDHTWLTAGPPLEAHLQKLAPYLTDDVVYTLCACHVGAAPDHDNDFGRLDAVMGDGSFADKARKVLTDVCGKSRAAVWAHACKGDALRNPVLRCFTRAGNADITWLIAGKPTDAQHARDLAGLWLRRFPNYKADSDPMFLEFINLTLQNPTDRVAEILR